MRIVSFFVPGDPVGKARPRVVDGHAYTPSKTKAYEHAVRLAYREAAIGRGAGLTPIPKSTGVDISVWCYYRIPKSASKSRRAKMLDWEIKPMKKPDLDNVLKVVADALNGVAYEDDCQIVVMSASKRYSETPGIRVAVGEVPV